MTDTVESDIDFEEELERVREDTPLSETITEPTETPNDAPKSKSQRVLSTAEQTLQSQVLLLCSALGGIDPSSERKEYVLGADALACLKDLKRWLKRVDDETKTWHVAAACHDNALVENDLVPIMVQIPRRINAGNQTYMQSILLSTLELLVALTKPLVLDIETASPAQIDLYMRLKKSHVKCKNGILNRNKGRCLKSVVGLALPILAVEKEKRSSRDMVILNLCLHFFRNVIRIQPADFTVTRGRSTGKTQQVSDNMPPGVSAEDVSYDNLVAKFEKNKVLVFVQTITANLDHSDSAVLAPVCLDIYFYLVYGIVPSSLFQKSHISHTTADKSGLADLISREKEIKKQLFANKMTRHANFGTLLSIKEGKDEEALTVATQRSFTHSDPIEELDSAVSKKQAAARYKNRNQESTRADFDTRLETPARKLTSEETIGTLKQFCSDFTEAGFASLVTQVMRLSTSSSKDMEVFAQFRYYYVISWMLQFERFLQKDFRRFGYVTVCLEERMIKLLLVVSIPKYEDKREYNLLGVSAGCFREILLTALAMHQLEPEKVDAEQREEVQGYVDASESVLRNIFEDEFVLEPLFRIPREAHKVSLRYATDMTLLCHVLLKTLHYLSKLKMPIVLAKKVRRSSKRDYGADHDPTVAEDESDDEYDLSRAENVKRFQVLDKKKYRAFEEKLLNDKVVDTYVWVFSRFAELDEAQVHRCVSFFTKLLLNWKVHFLQLVRLDFMLALHDIKNASFSAPTMKELGKLLSYYMRILQKLHTHSGLIFLEALTSHAELGTDVQTYLLGGDLEAVKEKQAQSRAPDMTFTDANMSYSHKLSVLVSGLYYADRSELVRQLCAELTALQDKRAQGDALQLEDKLWREERKDPRFRLLLETIGFAGKSLPLELTNEKLEEARAQISTALDHPLESFEVEGQTKGGGIVAEASSVGELGDFIAGNGQVEDLASGGEDNLDLAEAELGENEDRAKGRAVRSNKKRRRRRAELDSEDDDEIQFKRAPGDKTKKKKKKRGPRKQKGVEKAAAKEVSKPHLSTKYVDSSDDESDEDKDKAFFENEQRLLQQVHQERPLDLDADASQLEKVKQKVVDAMVSESEDSEKEKAVEESMMSETSSEEEDESDTEKEKTVADSMMSEESDDSEDTENENEKAVKDSMISESESEDGSDTQKEEAVADSMMSEEEDESDTEKKAVADSMISKSESEDDSDVDMDADSEDESLKKDSKVSARVIDSETDSDEESQLSPKESPSKNSETTPDSDDEHIALPKRRHLVLSDDE